MEVSEDWAGRAATGAVGVMVALVDAAATAVPAVVLFVWKHWGVWCWLMASSKLAAAKARQAAQVRKDRLGVRDKKDRQ